jgi:hypothetical protein
MKYLLCLCACRTATPHLLRSVSKSIRDAQLTSTVHCQAIRVQFFYKCLVLLQYTLDRWMLLSSAVRKMYFLLCDRPFFSDF